MLLVGRQEGHPTCKNIGGMVEVGTGSPDGVAPSWMVGVSASVILHLKVQKFFSGTGSPRWFRKKGRKMVVVWWWQPRAARNQSGSSELTFLADVNEA